MIGKSALELKAIFAGSRPSKTAGKEPLAPSKSKALPAKKYASPTVPSKGKFGAAMQHHQNIGSALAAGDGKTAMQHIGRAMLAIRNVQSGSNSPDLADGDNQSAPLPGATQTPGSPMQALRSRLSGLNKRSLG